MKKIGLSMLMILTVLFSVFAVSASAETDSIVIFSRDSISLYPAQTYRLMLSDSDTDNVEFVSSNNKIASVSSDGMVTAISAGTSIITAKFSNGYTSQCTVEVKNGVSPQDILLDTQSITLTVGSGKGLTATVYPEDVADKTVYYSSSDNSIATVNEQGYISAVGVGVAVISAESSSSAVAKKCIVKVNSKSGTSNFAVSVSGTVYSLSGGQESGVTLELKNNKDTKRTSTDKSGYFSFEDVAQGNYVLSLYNNEEDKNAAATTQISVSSYNINVSCIVNKNEIVLLYQDSQVSTDDIEDITLEKSSLILDCGEEYDMTFTVRPSDIGTPVLKASSSDEDIATVNADGRITAVSEGKTTVVFSTIDGKISKSCVVTVTDVNSNTYSWVIILLETMILLIIVIVFIYFYKKFLRQKEKEEMGEL